MRLLFGVIVMLCPVVAPAQFDADYQTNIISGVVSNWSGDYIVGSNTVFDLLRIESSGILSNGLGYIGYETYASNNSAIVTGSGSVWSIGDKLYVGYSSAGNSLTISNGGAVLAQEIIVGNVSNSEGTVNIVGGSLAANVIVVAQLFGSTGRFHASNASILATASTFIKDGEMYLSNCTASVGFLGLALGSGTHGTLTAADSTLTVSGDLSIGDYLGTGTVWLSEGQLVATNGTTYVSNLGGGQMTCSNSFINLATLTVCASSFQTGTLTISGGSLFARQFDVAHGGYGSTGVVWICDGATVTATNDTSIVGESGIGSITISNSAVRLAALTLGKYILVDTRGTLTVAGGTVTLTGALTAGEQAIAGTPAASKGTIWLTGGQLIATNAPVSVGYGGIGEMIISNGAVLANMVIVASNVTAQGTLTLAGGTLTILGGPGRVLSIGTEIGATGTVWMTGGQLSVTNGFTTIGAFGVGRMMVSNGYWRANGVTVGSGKGTLTVAGGAHNLSELNVGGSSSTSAVWLTGGQLTVSSISLGLSYGVGQMTVSNGAWEAVDANVGAGLGAQGTLTVDGGTGTVLKVLTVGNSAANTGTVWLTGGQLTADRTWIGQVGTGRMIVSNGTWVTRSVLIPQIIELGGGGTLAVAGGTSSIYSNLTLGNTTCKLTGTVSATSGNLFVTNSTASAVVDVLTGTFTVSGGNVVVDRLVITNACGHFIHTAGNLVVGLLLLDPAMDADGDGLPNGWEQSYGLDPLTPNAADDPDGDGLSNAQEYALGTDPNDSSSPFHIAGIETEGDDVRVIWQTVAGNTNAVQASPQPAGMYSDISPAIHVHGSGVVTTNFLDLGAATNFTSRFYRVRRAL